VTGTKLGRLEVAQILEDFLEGSGAQWAWDDFTSASSVAEERLEEIRRRCVHLRQEFPPKHPREYCNDEGRDVIRRFIAELRRS
jgi:hypothetical protein